MIQQYNIIILRQLAGFSPPRAGQNEFLYNIIIVTGKYRVRIVKKRKTQSVLNICIESENIITYTFSLPFTPFLMVTNIIFF